MSFSNMGPASAGGAAGPSSGSSMGGQGSGGADGQGNGQDSGFAIILAFQQDGSIQVMSQGGDGGSGGGDGSQGGQDQPQVVDNLQDALQAVEQLAQDNGYGDDSGGGMGAGGAYGASGGNDGGPGADGNAELAPDDAQSAWNQMAAQSDKRRRRALR